MCVVMTGGANYRDSKRTKKRGMPRPGRAWRWDIGLQLDRAARLLSHLRPPGSVVTSECQERPNQIMIRPHKDRAPWREYSGKSRQVVFPLPRSISTYGSLPDIAVAALERRTHVAFGFPARQSQMKGTAEPLTTQQARRLPASNPPYERPCPWSGKWKCKWASDTGLSCEGEWLFDWTGYTRGASSGEHSGEQCTCAISAPLASAHRPSLLTRGFTRCRK